jgi:hypothetical protein
MPVESKNIGTHSARMKAVTIHKLHTHFYGKSPGGLYIRHAERPEVERHSTYNGLSPNGFVKALEAGEAIGGEWLLLHSPVMRCLQTATCFGWGLALAGGKGHPPICESWLAGQLLYHDHDKAMDFLFRVGVQKFMIEWREGRIPSSIVSPIATVVREVAMRVRDVLQKARCPALMVTHDINILHFTQAAGIPFEKHSQPDFMDGVSVDLTDSGLRISHWLSTSPSEALIVC